MSQDDFAAITTVHAMRLASKAWTLSLLGLIYANWDLLVRTYEGPGT